MAVGLCVAFADKVRTIAMRPTVFASGAGAGSLSAISVRQVESAATTTTRRAIVVTIAMF